MAAIWALSQIKLHYGKRIDFDQSESLTTRLIDFRKEMMIMFKKLTKYRISLPSRIAPVNWAK